MKTRAILFLLLVLPCLTSHAAELSPYNIQYQTKAQGFTLKTVRKLEKKADLYELSQITSTMLMQTNEISKFHIDNKGALTPHSFSYQRKIMGNNSSRQTNFSSSKKIASYTEKGEKTVDVKTPAEIYDIFSFQEKMRLDIINHPQKNTGFIFNVLERRRIRQHEFRITGSEWINTSLGYIHTIKLERIREDSPKKTITWLAKDWDYVIVKMQHSEKGEPDYILNLVKGTVNNKEIKGEKSAPTVTQDAVKVSAENLSQY